MSTTVITLVTPDSQEAVNSQLFPTSGGKQESIERIASYLSGIANGSVHKTTLTIEIGSLPQVVL